MAKYIIYNHGGSQNHGCEALVRTVCNLIGSVQKIYSEAPQQDEQYGLENIAALEPACKKYSKISLEFLKAYLQLKMNGDYFLMDCLPYQAAIKQMPPDVVEISVGGDIYCYDDYPKFIKLHKAIAKNHKSVLLGCSLEKTLFDDPEFVDDMKRYSLITARESLTYQHLRDAGIENVQLIPDSAFILEKELLDFPESFDCNNIVGINISPLVLRKEKQKGIVLENFIQLVRYILDKTNYTIALIPHVVWEDNDDREALQTLYDAVGKTDRIILINDCNAMQLKGFISRCRFFIGARTHATIAAYSSCVPTLVIGYSIKSKGIATDLFGTDKNYVVSVQDLEDIQEVTKAFMWLQKHEEEIREHLNQTMPQYIQAVYDLKKHIELI